MDRNLRTELSAMADLAFLLLTVSVFAVLAYAIRGLERL
jgi:hypothetical protein